MKGGYTLEDKMSNKLNVRIEYEPTTIRHIAVQCPKCGKWFKGKDLTKDRLYYEHDINYAQFECPSCGNNFTAYREFMSMEVSVEEVDYPNVYKDCLQKKEVWE